MHPGRYPNGQPGRQQPRPSVRWVATVPPGENLPRPRGRRRPYTGPPRYPSPPRWGFPNLVWRPSTAVPGTSSGGMEPRQRLRSTSRSAVTLLIALAVLAGLAAVAEGWRYVLLLQSRTSALSPGVVGASDAFVLAFALMTPIMALLAVGGALWWLFVARSVAARDAGQDVPRPAWQVLVGTLVPGANLLLAGPIVAELEHAALRRPVDRRPRPSRLVLGWWATWCANVALAVVTVVWRLRDGVQVDADGVVLSALTDACAAGLAIVTAVLVHRITRLLSPVGADVLALRQVVKVTGAPEPERRPRPATSAR
ncbi:DUF4328 domain-containing protein [Prauserella halophila]|uniref:DUF4328 domain-containing protein n=1 Tax=Prauserella halophila TaxID=185641 RepID=A0ABP4HAD5_9PSEU|nr:DUF4328 domain-containing protein [Prauserella halophila]MCP2237639.1 protein of unknown function (DUF4328) [Prauserella halophila]